MRLPPSNWPANSSRWRNRQGLKCQREESGMITPRERVSLALQHREADRVPLDLGSTQVTGMHVDVVYKLRQALQLDPSGTPIKVVDPFQMLGEIKPDLIERLGVDVVGVPRPRTMFGFRNEGWKPWTTFAGTPVLVPDAFNTELDENGDLLMYPEGDRAALPSGRMPKDGFYFDEIVRQPPLDESKLNVEDNSEEFQPLSDRDLEYYRREADRLYKETDKAIVAGFGGMGFGDIAQIPAPFLKSPKGIRDIEEWYISTLIRQDYVYAVFERQCEIALRNLEAAHDAVGEKIAVCYITGTDFGAQEGPFISPKTYRDLYKPFHKQINDWVHHHTTWKTFIHSCGSVRALIPDFIDAGFDILNPVQCSAAGMAPAELKREFGAHVTFWGGGVDTQHTLPFGSSDDVRAEVRKRLEIFGMGGGYVFNPIHNVQARVPIQNILAMYETVQEFGRYAN
jgi:Uroporphyrinogen decarboxylase (URO-D)